VTYLSASAVVIQYEEALCQVYAPLPLPFILLLLLPLLLLAQSVRAYKGVEFTGIKHTNIRLY